MGYANIDPDALTGSWKWLRLYLADNGGVPAVSLADDGRGLRVSFEGTVPEDLDVSDLRENEPTVFKLRSVAVLRIAKRVVPTAPLEPRIPRLLAGLHAAKEVLERVIHATKDVLQDLAMDGLEVAA